MKHSKKLCSLLLAGSMVSALFCGTTASAADRSIDKTRDGAVAEAQKCLNYYQKGDNAPDNWCAHFVSNVLGYERFIDSRYNASVTSIALMCLYNNDGWGTLVRKSKDSGALPERFYSNGEPDPSSYLSVAGAEYSSSVVPNVGSLILYDEDLTSKSGLEHIGIVVKTYSDGTFDTIEGNYTNFQVDNLNDSDAISRYNIMSRVRKDDLFATYDSYVNTMKQCGLTPVSASNFNRDAEYEKYKPSMPVLVKYKNINKKFIYGYIRPNYRGPKRGDVDGNGVRNLADIATFQQYLNKQIKSNRIDMINADYYDDDILDITDLTYMTLDNVNGKFK